MPATLRVVGAESTLPLSDANPGQRSLMPVARVPITDTGQTGTGGGTGSGGGSGFANIGCDPNDPFCTLANLLAQQQAGGAPMTPGIDPSQFPGPTALPTQGTTTPGAVAALVLLVVAGVIAYFYWKKHQHHDEGERSSGDVQVP